MLNKINFQLFKELSAAIILLLAAMTNINAQYEGAKPVPKDWESGFQSIKIEDSRNILGFLAGPDFLGRSPMQSGFPAAAGFAAGHFRQLGLKPLGTDNAFIQRFAMTEVRVIPESATIESADGSLRFEFGKDFIFRVPDNFETREKFVFINIPKGADASNLDINNLKGKIVIISPNSISNSREALIKLFGPDAAALRIVIPAKTNSAFGEPGVIQKIKDAPVENPFTSLRITEDAINKIALSCEAKNYLAVESTQASIETCGKDFIFKSKVSAKELFETMNVIAKIEGSDPVLKNEAVFIGAHLDHFGVGKNGVMWGADDDASGVTAVMLIAQGIIQNSVKPKRTIIFALWSGEELGTLGSSAYVARPLFPLDKTIAYLNLDMVGRNEEDSRFNEKPEKNTTSVYTGSVKINSEDFYKILVSANAYVNLRLKDDHEDRTMRSDTRNFYQKNIPTLKTFTGEHADYHRQTDTPDKINYEKLTNIAKWLYVAAMELSVTTTPPRFEKKPFVAAPNASN